MKLTLIIHLVIEFTQNIKIYNIVYSLGIVGHMVGRLISQR